MKSQKTDREAIREDIVRSGERSPLFWFLLESHDWIVEQADSRRLNWTKLCLRFDELGLTGATGKRAGTETARSTWRRVRKEKARVEARRAAAEAERAARAAANPRRNMPSQFLGRDYSPPLAASPKTALPAAAGLWKGKYQFGDDGFIIVIDGPSSGVLAKQQRNLRSRRPINDDIDHLVKSKD
jgi:hypothetical protein